MKLSAEEREALRKYADANGRTWKSKLRRRWERADCSQVMQGLRNRIGPKGLARITLADLKPPVVFILAGKDGLDLVFRIVAEGYDISPVYRLPGEEHRIGYNPYIVYGPHISKFLHASHLDTTINVFQATSGSLI